MSPDPIVTMAAALRTQITGLAIGALALGVGLPLALLWVAQSSGEAYWRLFRGEFNVVEWVSSVQLLLVAAIAHLNTLAARACERLGIATVPRYPWIWSVFATGFVVLALDERFDIHEALRDVLFEPSGLFTEVPGLIDGDVGLYLFLLVGLAFTPFLWDELRAGRTARYAYFAALLLALPVIVIDSLTDSAMAGWPARRFWDYPFEELGELWSGALFLASFSAVLARRLRRLEPGDTGSAREGDEHLAHDAEVVHGRE